MNHDRAIRDDYYMRDGDTLYSDICECWWR